MKYILAMIIKLKIHEWIELGRVTQFELLQLNFFALAQLSYFKYCMLQSLRSYNSIYLSWRVRSSLAILTQFFCFYSTQ